MAERRDPMPRRVRPMLARDGNEPPRGDEWAFEIKWDGVRATAGVEAGHPQLCSRSLESLNRRYPELAALSEAANGHDILLDGEIVAIDEDGRPSFQLLQRRMGLTSEGSIMRRVRETPVTYMIFDLLQLDGRTLFDAPYSERRSLLQGLGLDGPHWQTPAHHVEDGAALIEATKRQGLEGVVAKRLDGIYIPGKRSSAWIKIRNRPEQELVIGGYTPGGGARPGQIGALLVGYCDTTPEEAERMGREQRVVFAGGVGTGFTEEMLKRLGELLEPLRRDTSPFDIGGPKRRDAVFCEPRLVAQVQFTEWTRAGTLRQPAFKGLREDKDPREVVREVPG